jgi:hypothetical protein
MSSTRRGNMKKLLVVVATLAAIGLGAPTASAAICDPILTSGENLTQVAANCPGSTTFTIKDGAYTLSGEVNVDSGDTFKGVYSDRTRPKIHANGATTAFDVGGTNAVTISGLSVSGAGGGDWCEPGCGSAIRGEGTNLHVFNVRLHHNPNQGIGNPGEGFLLENSTIDHNGSYSFTIMDRDSGKEPSSSAGVKILNAGTFRNNKIHDNYWIGIWCDEFGGPIIATDNNIYDNGKAGIQYEICRGRGPGSKIKNNTVTHNGHIDQDVPSTRAGIVLQDPQSVEVAYNTIRENREHGIHTIDANRQSIFGVKIHRNYFRNDTLEGCNLSGVECWANGGYRSAGERYSILCAVLRLFKAAVLMQIYPSGTLA